MMSHEEMCRRYKVEAHYSVLPWVIGWRAEIYSVGSGEVLGITQVHRHAQSAAIIDAIYRICEMAENEESAE